MFPVHQPSLTWVAFLGAAAIVAMLACRLGLGRWGWGVVTLLAVLGLAWPWAGALGVGLDDHTIGSAARFGAASAGAVIAGALWGALSRRLLSGIAALGLAVLPSVGTAAYLLERQRVPAAACAERAIFAIGGLRLEVPREMGARSKSPGDGPAPAWQGTYGPWRSVKPDVAALCRASDGGTQPIAVRHLWMSAHHVARLGEAGCEGDPAETALSAECRARERGAAAILQLYESPEAAPAPTYGQFDGARVGAALAAGETSGAFCPDGPPETAEEPGRRYCTLWYWPSPEVLAVATKWTPVPSTEAEILADGRVVIDTMLSELARDDGG